MSKRIRPGIDRALAPAHGLTRDGQPISYNRAPARDLAPWIARLYVTKVEAPPDYRLRCGIFNDTAYVRIQLAGEWTAETAGGTERFGRAALFFGPQTRRMPISVTGSFISLGMSPRPGVCHGLLDRRLTDHVDRLSSLTGPGIAHERLLAKFDPEASPEEWLQVIEAMVRERLSSHDCNEPDAITTRFEIASFTDPSISIAAFARGCGIEKRTLERIVRRDFGLSPKQVLCRARALDMASHLRGVADSDEADELALRYYDQSHLIHEFTELFGMSPRQFVATPQPILTLALESRQARRLELIERIAPGGLRPWQ